MDETYFKLVIRLFSYEVFNTINNTVCFFFSCLYCVTLKKTNNTLRVNHIFFSLNFKLQVYKKQKQKKKPRNNNRETKVRKKKTRMFLNSFLCNLKNTLCGVGTVYYGLSENSIKIR